MAYFSFQGGSNHFNDKPILTVDTNLSSPFRDRVYIAWDAASGGSTGGGIRVASSPDGTNFTVTRADDPNGPGRAIGAVPFVGPGGELYVAWNDYAANTIAFNRSFDGGATWGQEGLIADCLSVAGAGRSGARSSARIGADSVAGIPSGSSAG